MYYIKYSILLISVLSFTAMPAFTEELLESPDENSISITPDTRQLVSIPAEARALMRKDMLDHLSSLNEIIGYLAVNNFDAASETAEKKLGQSSMGKHRDSGFGPGKYMPINMRKLGMGMHQAASEFSSTAKEGDKEKAYQALQKITAACVSCHYSYRTN